jgi:hypothetical protein
MIFGAGECASTNIVTFFQSLDNVLPHKLNLQHYDYHFLVSVEKPITNGTSRNATTHL